MRPLFLALVCSLAACFSGGRDTPPLHGAGVIHIDEKTQEVSLDPAVPVVLACPNDSLVHKGATGAWECVAKAPAAVQADNSTLAANAAHAVSADQLVGLPLSSIARTDSSGNLDLEQGRVLIAVTMSGVTSRISSPGVFCGPSTPTAGKFADPTGGTAVGYAAGKLMCEAVTACGPSAAAHVCSIEEAARSAQLNLFAGYGDRALWVTGQYSTFPGSGGVSVGVVDCYGWTDSTSTNAAGSVWRIVPSIPRNYPDANICTTMNSIACCK